MPPSSRTGVCFGMAADQLPSKEVVLSLYATNDIQKMRLYDPNQETLGVLNSSNDYKNIEIMLGVPNTDLRNLSQNPAKADEWVEKNVKTFDRVNFRYIVVGNGVSRWNSDTEQFVEYLLPAMRNMFAALRSAQLTNRIKVSTALDIGPGPVGVLEYKTTPSLCRFKGNAAGERDQWIQDLLDLLGSPSWGSPLLVNIHPFHFYPSNNNNLNYALFLAGRIVLRDQYYDYNNLFDALLDSVYVALQKVGHSDMTIIVSETGWPTDGASNATPVNAGHYNNKLIRHALTTGTPRKMNKPIEAYIYAMFDENQKKGNEYQRHWGIFEFDQTLKYNINFNINTR